MYKVKSVPLNSFAVFILWVYVWHLEIKLRQLSEKITEYNELSEVDEAEAEEEEEEAEEESEEESEEEAEEESEEEADEAEAEDDEEDDSDYICSEQESSDEDDD